MAIALVTGASSGIGSELARVLAEKRYDLVLVARREDRLLALANELTQKHDVKTVTLVKDLARPGAAQELFDEVQARKIVVDALVNNAGFGEHGAVVDVPLEKMQAMVQVNVTTLMELSRLFAPVMVRRGSGRILNVASVVSFTAAPYMGVYAATKAFVLSFSEAMATELKGTGVTVTALCPGTTESEFFEAAKMANTNVLRYRVMKARPVAEIGVEAMLRGRPVAIAGVRNRMMVLAMKLSPRAMVLEISKKVMEPRR